MKKIVKLTSLFLVLIFIISSCGTNNNGEVITDKDNQEIEESIENESVEIKNKNTIEADTLYTDSSNVLIFDGKIDSVKISEEFREKIEKENTKLFKFEINEDNILVGYKPIQKIRVKSKYIGLADSNVAEFSFNEVYFRLNISPEIMEKLSDIEEGKTLELLITSPENKESNCTLSEIYI